MDWSNPYLLISLSILITSEVVFAVLMISTAQRHKRLTSKAANPAKFDEKIAVTPEELGLLAGADIRFIEVVLCRLLLEQRLAINDDGLWSRGQVIGDPPADNKNLPIVKAIVQKIDASEQPLSTIELMRAVANAARIDPIKNRLIKLNLLDWDAIRNVQLRRRTVLGYLAISSLAMFAVMVSIGLSGRNASHSSEIHLSPLAMFGVFAQAAAVTIVSSKFGGGKFPLNTAAGNAVVQHALNQERAEEADISGDQSILRRVALFGLTEIPGWKGYSPNSGGRSGRQKSRFDTVADLAEGITSLANPKGN